VKRRMSVVEKPAKLLALINSYRFMLSSSVTMHRWPRKEKWPDILITLCLSSGSFK
jgi:hypothetical protein